MKHSYKKTKHPSRDGYLLIFAKRIWSCVDLTQPSKMKLLSPKFKKVFKEMTCYHGRYEAMIIEDEEINPDHQIRANSFKELFAEVEKYNEELNKQNEQ